MKNIKSLIFIPFILLCLGGCNNKKPTNEVVNLDLYAFNDFHGNVMDSSTGLGISKTTSLLKSRQDINEAILISQGDMWQGSAESNITRGALVTEWMNQNGFVSMTLGNHEFDWGEEPVKENSLKADFPFLAINIFNKNTDEPVSYCKPSTIIERKGAKIGIIGAIGDCYSSIAPSQVKDIYFKVGDELTDLVKKEATRLKEEGCDMVIYSLHFDDADYDITLSGDYVDLVLEGHTHQNYIKQDVKGIYHVQGGGYNKTIPYINFDLDLKTNKVDVKRARALTTKDFSYLTKDEQTEALFNKYNDTIGEVRNPIGNNKERRNSEFLRQLVADLYLAKGVEKWGATYELFLGGGYLSCRSPYYLPQGPVSYADIYTLFPFDNDLVLCSTTGYYLSKQFVNSQKENYFISYTELGNTYKNNINYNSTYYLITDTYSADYEPNHLTTIASYDVSGYYARDMLKEYIAAGNLA